MQDDQNYYDNIRGGGSSADHLAAHVISVLRDRKPRTQSGARQFILDFLVRAILSKGDFDPDLMLSELRGYRLTVDAVIDTYVPAAAHALGEMWVKSEINFAEVTIGALRLQAVLGEASAESTSILRTSETDLSMLIVVPENEQHFLGASVIAAQLRRLGCHVASSFCEPYEDILSRVLCDHPNAVLFTCSRLDGLETIRQTVFSIKETAHSIPLLALGGAVEGSENSLREATGVDLVTNTVKDVVSLCMKNSRNTARE